MCAAGFANGRRHRVDGGELGPAACSGVCASFGGWVEDGGVRDCGVDRIDLWAAGVCVPGERVDGCEADISAEVEMESSAIAAGAEEQVGLRVVVRFRDSSVCEAWETSSVGVELSVDQLEGVTLSCVVGGGGGEAAEGEIRGIGAMFDFHAGRCGLQEGVD